ncbi:transglycosylase SLT domain-containing protein [Streptomyces sp. NPDC020917]|uniref:transglycosylase SLT domain-containing protein n=1 Tax=Streptomyces sp. NPDC020917 TaxID=3365102 RepID=UPI0037885E2F
MARHARPRTHRKTRNSALAVVTIGAAALTVGAVGAGTASAADGHGSSSASARQSGYAHQWTHDGDSRSWARPAAQESQPQAKTTWHHHHRHTTAKHARPATTPKPATTTAPAPAATSTSASTATATPAASTTTTAVTAATGTSLDGWIKQALAVMAQHNIPGTYDGIYRNIMRESSGDPNAVNNWDSNAAAGHPSKGLLQVIQPTFDTYHVAGTSNDIMDPVANIVAACNYAAAMYGSIDNVNGPY